MKCTNPKCEACYPKIVKCKSCNADIFFITTQDGFPHPCNAKELKVWIPYHGRGYNAKDIFWQLHQAFESHFATCPDAEHWRKK